MLFSSLAGFAQFQFKGKIVAEDDSPLPGAVIRIENTNIGTISDANGDFTLSSIDEGIVLVVSFVGYKPLKNAVSLPLKETLVVRLIADDILMEEVRVSTGYQVLSPEQTTGAFSKTSNALLNRRVSTDLISRLEDLSPGLVFNKGKGRAGQLLVRGQHTINSAAAPLIVIDNFPYDGDLNNINPNDVESVTILKDASSASIWGARAGNGVIVITTKAGKNSPLKVSVNSNVTVGAQPDIFYQPRMSTADFISQERALFEAGSYDAALRSANKLPLTPVAELLQAAKEGRMSQQEAEGRISELQQLDVRDDYSKYLYQPSLNQQYSIGINGGSNAHNYYLAAGYDNNRTALVGNQNERYTFSFSNNYRFTDKLQTAASVYYTVNNANQNHRGVPTFTNPLSGIAGTRMYPYARLVDESGNPQEVIYQYRPSFLDEKYAQGFLDWGYSPLREMENINRTSTTKDLRINASATYNLNSDLSISLFYQFNSGENRGSQLYGEESYFTRNEINRFTQLSTEGRIIRPIPLGGILDESLNSYQVHNPRFLTNYNKKIGENHSILAMGGTELRDFQSTGSNGRLYGYDAEHGTSRVVDYTSVFLSAINPLTSFRIDNRDTRSGNIDRYFSYYANGAYTYKNRYTVSVSGRRDLSNLFGVSTNQKGVPLWSGGLAWNIHNEKFFDKERFSYFKLRTTYGVAGNSNKSVSAFTTASFSSGVDQITGLPFATIANPPNPSLRWERVNTLNFGLDFETTNRFLKGSLDYYQKAGNDLIGLMPYPGSSGVKTLTGNYAETRGHGIDAQVIASWFRKEVNWSTMFNVSYVKDKVTRYDMTSNSTIYLGSGDGASIYPLKGRPLYSVYSLLWAGLDPQTGDPMGFADGETSKAYSSLISIPADEMIFNGPARPVVSGAVINTVSYKGVSLSTNINYKLGYYFRSSSLLSRDVFIANLAHGDYAKRWQNPGDELHTIVPSMPVTVDNNRDSFYSFSEALVGRGDHIRLQDINLGYQPSGKFLKKLPFSTLHVYLYLNNLGIIWQKDKSGLDPDYFFSDFRPPVTTSIGLKAGF